MNPPGPGHPISVAPNPNRVVVTFDGRPIASSSRALTMQESTYPPVHYIPRADVEMSMLERTTHSTHCPYKGDAAYYSLKSPDRHVENAVWTYEAPYVAMAAIKDHLAFYPKHVDGIEEQPA